MASATSSRGRAPAVDTNRRHVEIGLAGDWADRGAIAFGATRGSDDDSGNGAPAARQPAGGGSGSAGQASAGAGGGASAAGSLTAGGTNVLARGRGTDLSRYAGKNVRGHGVEVVLVVGNEAFWVGESASDRVLVHMDASGESRFKVKAGDRVTFTGRVARAGGRTAAKFGVTDAEGAKLLARQKQVIETDASRVSLAK